LYREHLLQRLQYIVHQTLTDACRQFSASPGAQAAFCINPCTVAAA
jgi:hypothetical protein